MIKITTEQVRLALIQIAEQGNRPYFAMCVVRDVALAIQNNTPHPLKSQVFQEIFIIFGEEYQYLGDDITESDKEILLEKLMRVRNYHGGQKSLVSEAKVGDRTISLLIRRKLKLSKTIYRKLVPIIDLVLNDLERRDSTRKELSHGNYVNYRKGCRCELCRVAWRVYIRNSKLKKQEELIA